MQRRDFLKGAGAGLATGASMASTAATADAGADNPVVKWRLASSFPKSLDTIFGASEAVAQRVAQATRVTSARNQRQSQEPRATHSLTL